MDVLVTVPLMGNEAANYMAHVKNASLVYFLTVPYILPWMAEAMGNPVNTAYMPLPFFGFSQDSDNLLHRRQSKISDNLLHRRQTKIM